MELTPIPFCGQSYTEQSPAANKQRTVNLYPALSPTPENPNRIILVPTPGYAIINGRDGEEIRGMFVVNGTLYLVQANKLYRYDTTLGLVELGTLNTSTGRCSLACNTVELAICDGTDLYAYHLTNGTFQAASGGSFPTTGIVNITCIDNYIIAVVKGSKRFIQSDLLSALTFGAQAYAEVITFPDNLTAGFSDENELYLFGPYATEVRYNAGSTPVAFEKRGGVIIPAGCVAWATIVKVGGSIIWLASDKDGKATVAALEGYTPKSLSHPPLEEFLERQTAENLAAAYGFSYREGDTLFYVLTLPTGSWACDVKTGQWHERDEVDGKCPVTFCVMQNAKRIIGTSTGLLAYMSQDYSQGYYNTFYDSDSRAPSAVIRSRTGPHLSLNGRNIFLHELEFEMETGVGVNEGPRAGFGSFKTPLEDPQVTLEISRDRGRTWKSAGTKPLGKTGEYKTRVVWRNLGRSKWFTFRLSISDPVRTYIMGARWRVTAGK